MRDAGVPTGKKWEILQDVSRLLPGYNRIVKTFANGYNTGSTGVFLRDTMLQCTILLNTYIYNLSIN